MKTTSLINRNVHAPQRTSIRLEAEFWSGLDEMASAVGVHRDQLVINAGARWPGGSLTSAVRVLVLTWFRDRAGKGGADE